MSILMDVRHPENRAGALKGYRWKMTGLEGKLRGRKAFFGTGPLELEQLAELLKPMTDKHRAMADIANDVLDNWTKPELTKASVELFGFDMFQVRKYWAMHRDLPLSLGGAKEALTPFSERGFTQARKGGGDPLWLSPFFKHLHHSVEESTAYAKMLIPVYNAKSILTSRSWQAAMKRAGRLDEMDRILDKFRTLERAVTTKDSLELFGGMLLRGFGRSKLGLNGISFSISSRVRSSIKRCTPIPASPGSARLPEESAGILGISAPLTQWMNSSSAKDLSSTSP
jgi:hypothetical protein